MDRLKITEVNVTEGPLYQVMGEDEPIITFYAFIEARGADGVLYCHKHAFPGHGKYPAGSEREGMNHLIHSRDNAEKAAEKILAFGSIDKTHWDVVDETPRDLEADWEDEYEREMAERNWNLAYA